MAEGGGGGGLAAALGAYRGERPPGGAPPAAGEAAVASAGPPAANVLLEHDHGEVRVALGQEVGGPQPGEAAPDDDDIRPGVPVERRAGLLGLLGLLPERVPQPPAALRPRS